MSSKPLRPIKLGPPGEDIDKKDLLAIIRRFQNLHQLQLQRIQGSLTNRQRDFLELLPLLFHTNHPLLPGFVSTETPAGIPDYQPRRVALQCAMRQSKSFEYKRSALYDPPVHALYLMGSVGSIAYSRKSDLDIWLCHAPSLSTEGLGELKRKAKGVEDWANTLGLEVHIFFINPDEFRQGIGEPISTESCGSIQHHLLLEEFYRTSLHIAGRIPAWWLVPPEQENRYTAYLQHLKDNRFLSFRDIIDLGGLETISPDEFLGGTLWHLYKAIGSPHKSLLKLLLMESYAREFPHPNWLCTRLKAALYAGSLDVFELDSYILMYQKVETYVLARHESERLELARQCFYLKINELLAEPSVPQAEKRERREILKAMTERWGWDAGQVQALDKRRRWSLRQALDEQKRISRELNQNYQQVSRFAHEHAQQIRQQSEELTLLGRRLFAALERKPGKVEILSCDGYQELEAEDLSLHETDLADGDDGWVLYPGRVRAADQRKPEPLKKARSLIEIMAWLTLNGFYRKNINVLLETTRSTLTGVELNSSFDALVGFLKRQGEQDDQLNAYAKPSRIVVCALFINLGHDPEAGRKDGLQVISNRFDPLSFGAERVNLIHSIDLICITSWRETLVYRYKGLTGLLDCLCEVLNQSGGEEEPAPVFECASFTYIRSRSMALRVQRLYQDLLTLCKDSSAPRYVLRGGNDFYVFQKRAGSMRYWRLIEETQLLVELAQPRPQFAPVIFDEAALERSPIPTLYAKNKPDLIQIFLIPGQQTELYILDERGSLFHRLHPQASPEQVLSAYAQLIAAIQQRYVTSIQGLEYYRVDRNPQSGYALTSLSFPSGVAGKKLDIRVHGLEWSPGRTAYTIQCNEREFSSMDAGGDLFAQVAAHIFRLRQSGEQYPIYISDIDVPLSVLGIDGPEQLQTVHFLQYKRKIEDRLNG